MRWLFKKKVNCIPFYATNQRSFKSLKKKQTGNSSGARGTEEKKVLCKYWQFKKY